MNDKQKQPTPQKPKPKPLSQEGPEKEPAPTLNPGTYAEVPPERRQQENEDETN